MEDKSRRKCPAFVCMNCLSYIPQLGIEPNTTIILPPLPSSLLCNKGEIGILHHALFHDTTALTALQ